MAMFRSKKLDIGCFINVRIIRDHTKRKVFAEHETERYDLAFLHSLYNPHRSWSTVMSTAVSFY